MIIEPRQSSLNLGDSWPPGPDIKRTRKQESRYIIAASDPEEFLATFPEYIQKHWNIYLAFEFQALLLVNRGFKHYSSKTLICWLRYESDVAEEDSKYKINDKYVADLGRLFEKFNPDHEGFFRKKKRGPRT